MRRLILTVLVVAGRIWRASGPGAKVLICLGFAFIPVLILLQIVDPLPPSTARQTRTGPILPTRTVAPRTPTIQPSATPPIPRTKAPLPPPTDTPEPTNTPGPTNTSKPTIVPFPSGGLGLDISTWEQIHKKTGKGVMGSIYDDTYEMAGMDGYVWYIYMRYKAPVSPEKITSDGKRFFPFDAVLIETYSPSGRPETTVHLYHSKQLIPRFKKWIGGSPGQFTFQYNTYDGQSTSWIIAPGNNP